MHPIPLNACWHFLYLILIFAGDMEFKQNKFLPAEKQIVTANPDISVVSIFIQPLHFVLFLKGVLSFFRSGTCGTHLAMRP